MNRFIYNAQFYFFIFRINKKNVVFHTHNEVIFQRFHSIDENYKARMNIHINSWLFHKQYFLYYYHNNKINIYKQIS